MPGFPMYAMHGEERYVNREKMPGFPMYAADRLTYITLRSFCNLQS
uniref:Uncharacterized protein n=1 Tax=Arundo donax TaxID=35708 RepID=A0A0A8XP24_ARUDO